MNWVLRLLGRKNARDMVAEIKKRKTPTRFETTRTIINRASEECREGKISAACAASFMREALRISQKEDPKFFELVSQAMQFCEDQCKTGKMSAERAAGLMSGIALFFSEQSPEREVAAQKIVQFCEDQYKAGRMDAKAATFHMSDAGMFLLTEGSPVCEEVVARTIEFSLQRHAEGKITDTYAAWRLYHAARMSRKICENGYKSPDGAFAISPELGSRANICICFKRAAAGEESIVITEDHKLPLSRAFSEIAISGSDENREQFRRFLDECRQQGPAPV